MGKYKFDTDYGTVNQEIFALFMVSSNPQKLNAQNIFILTSIPVHLQVTTIRKIKMHKTYFSHGNLAHPQTKHAKIFSWITENSTASSVFQKFYPSLEICLLWLRRRFNKLAYYHNPFCFLVDTPEGQSF